MKMPQLLKNRQGFTLVELLVAMTLLTVGLLSVASMQTVALNNGSISYKISAASYLAREAMDDIASWDIANVKLNTDATDAVYLNQKGGQTFTVVGGGTFTITYTTSTSTPAVGTTRIEVKVTDAGSGKAVRDVTITSFKRVV